MNYAEVRPLLETGDVIGVRHPYGFIGEATQHFTRSDYTHVGVVLRMANGVWMAELNSGRNHLIPLSQLQHHRFDVYHPPVTDRGKIRIAIHRWLRYQIEYGVWAFIAIGLMDYFKIKFAVRAKNLLVCSGYLIRIFQTAGWDSKISPVQSPREFLSRLELKFEVNPGSN